MCWPKRPSGWKPNCNTIIVGSEESGREFTFWISPLKWLGGNEENRGLESIVTLTEEIMGWKGQIVNDQAGRGLGGWLKWLRGSRHHHQSSRSPRSARRLGRCGTSCASEKSWSPPPPNR